MNTCRGSSHFQPLWITLDLCIPLYLFACLQLPELVQNIIPGCSLAELTALETILTALAQQGSLSAPVLVHLLVQDICHYYTKLQEHLQAERQRRRQQKQHDSGSGGAAEGLQREGCAADSGTAAMDVDNDAGAPQAAESDAAAAFTQADFIQQLRHEFTLLSLLSAAQPSALKAKYVPVLLEVGFSPDLSVSGHLLSMPTKGILCTSLYNPPTPSIGQQNSTCVFAVC